LILFEIPVTEFDINQDHNVTKPEYSKRLNEIYYNIKKRCYNEKHKDYYNYGARGIQMCEEWKNDRYSFLDWAYSSGYEDDLTIDRIDNLKGYSPDNCRWVTRADNNRNKLKHQLESTE